MNKWLIEKKFYWLRLLTSFFLSLSVLTVIVVSLWLFFLKNDSISPIVKDDSLPVSRTKPTFRSTTDNYPPSIYFPKSLTVRYPNAEEEIRNENVGDPRGITAKSWAAMDRSTGELLLAKNLTNKSPIASITKVMTALVALEAAPLSKELTVSDSATEAGEAFMGLTAGERLTVEELLYGLILPSGNDAAETLAEGVFKGLNKKARVTFLASMNRKAEEIGMYDTLFVNPTGLDEERIEQSSYSTPLDLLALGNYALKNSTFAKIAATKYMALPYKAGFHKAFYLTNILDFSKSYPGVKGIKPGVTDFAGETLLSYAENGGKQIILVLLGSQATKDDAVKIYDYLFAKMGINIVKS